mmetsp:Transcript_37703/g.150336  ORF Transcript_37703/g.150336 Transcript_37703/m.150336 type:complete len:90 (+) Transcript_37703:74-343(+)
MAFVGSGLVGARVGSTREVVCERKRQATMAMSLSRRDILSLGGLAALVPSFAFADEGIAAATKAAPTKVSGNYADGRGVVASERHVLEV